MKIFLPRRAGLAAGLTIAMVLAAASATGADGATGHDHPTGMVTVTGTNLAGKPDNGDPVGVMNADDSIRFNGPESVAYFRAGTVHFTVPAGHYWAIAVYFPGSHSARLDVLPQFTVPAAGHITVHTDARAATSKVTMVTPRAAHLLQTSVVVDRYSGTGPPSSQGATVDAGTIYVNPVAHRPTVGSLRVYSSQVLGSPPGSRVPYQYVLTYAGPLGTIPSPLRFVVSAHDVATVDESIYQSSPAKGLWSVGDLVPAADTGAGPVNFSVPLPLRQDVLYAGGNAPATTWQTGFEFGRSVVLQGFGQFQTEISLPAGRHLDAAWNRYPLHPDANAALAQQPLTDPVMPSATRAGNTLRLATTPFTDNQRGDTGSGFGQFSGSPVTGTYQVDQDGKKIAGGNAVTAAGGGQALQVQAPLRAGSSVIRFSLTASRAGRSFGLATASHTVWTWRSAGGPSSRLPSNWYCWNNGLDFHRTCTVQPMMTLEYDVARLGLNESAPSGQQTVTVTAGHLQLAKAASVTGASVSASFDGGKTWQKATVTPLGHGQFKATFTAPAHATVALRTTAKDAAGGSISETITGAYTTA